MRGPRNPQGETGALTSSENLPLVTGGLPREAGIFSKDGEPVSGTGIWQKLQAEPGSRGMSHQCSEPEGPGPSPEERPTGPPPSSPHTNCLVLRPTPVGTFEGREFRF